MEDDVVGIAKTVTDNYEDEELRDTLINISLDLYDTLPLSPASTTSMRLLTIVCDTESWNNQ